MKLTFTSIINNKRGEIGTIAVLVGMVVIGLGILVGSQVRNGNINIAPRASEPTANILWSQIKPGTNNIYPWSTINGITGPTTGWESYYGNRVYICNGEYCWEIVREGGTTSIANGGAPTQLSKNPSYVTAKPAGNVYPWSTINGVTGPTAAWTWVVPYGGKTVNETVVCNQNWCWRYIRTSDNVGSGLRDDGKPIYLPTGKVNTTDQINPVWSDSRVASLWSGKGLTTAWADTVNGYATLCNGTDCRSLDYKTWTWRYDGAKIAPIHTGKAISQVSAAWTSPVTSTLTQCFGNLCYEFKDGAYSNSPIIIAAPTNTPVPPTVKTCAAGQLLCANNCTNVTNNAQHCGACGKVCAQGQTCSNSKCIVPAPTVKTCAAGQLLCANNCTNVTNNAQHCGACGKVCAQGQVCSSSKCVAPTAKPVSVGALRVNITNAPTGAQWKRVGTSEWKNSGVTESNIPVGTYTIEYKPLDGYDKPANQSTTVSTLGPQVVSSGSYSRHVGSLKIIIAGSPPSGALWRRVNTAPGGGADAWRNNNFTDPSVPTGTYRIEFDPVNNYTSPATLTVVVTNGKLTTGNAGAYVRHTGNLKMTIPSAPTGAQWRRVGTTNWFNSTATELNLPTGSYTIEFKDITGFTKPANQTVSITNGKLTDISSTGRYVAVAPPNGGIGAITLASPINGVVLPIGNVTLRWNAATSATSYDWDVIRSSRRFKSGTGTGTSAVTSLLPGSYRWQVIAKNTNGTRESSFGEFKIPFSKIKPLNNTQITFGSTYSFEWTPLLPTDMSIMYFAIYNSASTTNPVYFKEIRTNSTEYSTGKLSLALNAATDSDFVSGRTYTWQLVPSRAGAASEHTPPNDNTGSPQTFTLVNVVTPPTNTPTLASTATPTVPVATATTAPSCTKRAQGDANCDGIIDYIDFVCWRGELSKSKPTNCISADFDNSGVVNAADYALWRSTFITSIN